MRRYIIGVAFLVVFSGCGGTGSEQASSASEESASAGVPLDDIDGGDATLEDFTSVGRSTDSFLRNATFELTRECMEEAGFQYAHPVLETEDYDVYLTPDLLRKFGYGLSKAQSDISNGIDRNLDALDSEEKKEFSAAFSHGEITDLALDSGEVISFRNEGCLPESRIAIYGSNGNRVLFNQAFEAIHGGKIRIQVESDPEHVSTVVEWEACLADNGLVVDEVSLSDQALANYETMSEEQAKDAELSLASVDAGCLEETGLDVLRVELVEQAQADVEESGAYDIAKVAVLQQQSLERAQKLLAE